MKRWIALWLALALPAPAAEIVQISGKLSDQDFYRAVACAAPPGGACTQDLVHWSKTDMARLTIGRDAATLAANPALGPRVEQAVAAAVSAVNAAGGGLRLVLLRSPKAKIRAIIQTDAQMAMPGALNSDGGPTPVPTSTSWSLVSWNHANRVSGAQIVLSEHARANEINGAVLVRTPGISLFSVNRGVSRLAGQDATALRIHYPAR